MLVFVYGSLRSDGDNSDKMRTACGSFQFPATTLKEFYKGNNGYFDYLMDEGQDIHKDQKTPIHGEVYNVPSQFVEYLDAFEEPLERKTIEVEFENWTYEVQCYFCTNSNEC